MLRGPQLYCWKSFKSHEAFSVVVLWEDVYEGSRRRLEGMSWSVWDLCGKDIHSIFRRY